MVEDNNRVIKKNVQIRKISMANFIQLSVVVYSSVKHRSHQLFKTETKT